MSEWVRPPEDFNGEHHDFVSWSDDRLQQRFNELYENNRNIGYTGERLSQVVREMETIAQEMANRYREKRDEDIEEAWSEK